MLGISGVAGNVPYNDVSIIILNIGTPECSNSCFALDIIGVIRFYTVRRKGFRLSFSEIMTRSEGMPQSIANVGSL